MREHGEALPSPSIPRTVTASESASASASKTDESIDGAAGHAAPPPHHRRGTLPRSGSHNHHQHRYNCVECLSPSASLYRVYSTPTSIKLTRCDRCGNDVDPYVERELLLVGIDLVLHRLPAYRHVLFNREPFSTFGGGRRSVSAAEDVDVVDGNAAEVDGDGDGDGDGGGASKGRHGEDSEDEEESAFRTCKRAAQYTLAGALLDAYLRYESMRSWSSGGSGESSGSGLWPMVVPFPALVTLSFLEHAALVLGVHAAANSTLNFYFGRGFRREDGHRPEERLPHLPTLPQTFVALTIPTAAKFAAIFILIWENTDTIGVLSSLFVLSFQFVSTRAIVERAAYVYMAGEEEIVPRRERRIPGRVVVLLGALPLVVGVVLRAALSRALTSAWSAWNLESSSSTSCPPTSPVVVPPPCSGISVTLPIVGAVCLT